MNLDANDTKAVQQMLDLDQQILHLSTSIVDKYRNKYVTITKGWRKGEKGAKAIITGGMFYHGEMLFLCMVVNKKDQIINRDAWTRKYRPASSFELITTHPQGEKR